MSPRIVALFVSLAAVASAEQTRPCSGNEFTCIQNYLVEATGRNAASSVQDVLVNKEPLHTDLPSFGITMESVDSFSGLADATFTDFFIENGYTILALNIPKLTRTSTAKALFYTNDAAPAVNHAAGNFVNYDMTLTIFFPPPADKLNVDDIYVVTTRNGETVSDFSTLDAGAATSEVIAAAQEAINANIEVYYKEVGLAPGIRLARDYLLTNVLA